MSKIAEQKAKDIAKKLEASQAYKFDNFSVVCGAIEGYDQALQDIKEFIYDKFNIHPHDCHVIQYVSDTPLEDIDDFVEQFKNYMQNEIQN